MCRVRRAVRGKGGNAAAGLTGGPPGGYAVWLRAVSPYSKRPYMPVPLLDLKAQFAAIRDDVLPAVMAAVEAALFGKREGHRFYTPGVTDHHAVDMSRIGG